ncbi:MAG: hypothetical protein JNM83_16050 [Myxococcales bacterium]|nr:hypothetical protein [Myxococcales bacterium]
MSLIEKGLTYGRLAWDEASHRARTVEEDLKARREVDIAGMVNGLRARLGEKLELEELPIDADLRSHALTLGVAKVSTWAYRSPQVRKIVLSHVMVGPDQQQKHLSSLMMLSVGHCEGGRCWDSVPIGRGA